MQEQIEMQLNMIAELKNEIAALRNRIASLEQRPYLGQRCHVNGVGFGTIVDLKPGEIRAEMDAGVARWYPLDTNVELLATYPVG
jgi:hypothetical protein